VPTGPEWVAEGKLDGYRCIAEILDQEIVLRTRTGNIISQVPYINRALQALPVGTILDGELVDLTNGADNSFKRTVSVLKKKDPQRVSGANLPLTYVVFDIVEANGESIADLPLGQRRMVLETLLTHPSLADQRLVDVKLLSLIDQFPSSDEAFDACIAAGYEGVVVKNLKHSYSFGARNWIKIKPDAEVEAICTGTYEAKSGSKYEGRCIGGITFTLTHEDGTVFDGQCAGKMNDTLRTELYDNPAKFVGMVVEIGHWGVTDNGSLRHPSFRRFREDKDASEVNSTPAPARGHKVTHEVHDEAATMTEKKKGKRNYKQMKPEKRLRVQLELREALEGVENEAVQKATDVEGDLIELNALIASGE
jgi:bifunctional non-homologous end joining protein LigD